MHKALGWIPNKKREKGGGVKGQRRKGWRNEREETGERSHGNKHRVARISQ